MIPNERPTPLTDAAWADKEQNILVHAKNLERSLAERTEERDELQRVISAQEAELDLAQCQRDDALAKLAEVTAERDEAREQWRMSSVCRELVAERDALKHALIELEAAAEVYAADQSRATDSRCGLVQPITVEDGNRLLSALKAANELTK